MKRFSFNKYMIEKWRYRKHLARRLSIYILRVCALEFISFQFRFFRCHTLSPFSFLLKSVLPTEQADILWEIFLTWWCLTPFLPLLTNWCQSFFFLFDSLIKVNLQQFYLSYIFFLSMFILYLFLCVNHIPYHLCTLAYWLTRSAVCWNVFIFCESHSIFYSNVLCNLCYVNNFSSFSFLFLSFIPYFCPSFFVLSIVTIW